MTQSEWTADTLFNVSLTIEYHLTKAQGTRFGINGKIMDLDEKYKDYTYTFLKNEPNNNKKKTEKNEQAECNGIKWVNYYFFSRNWKNKI